MSTTTYEDVLALFREVAEAQKASEREFQETKRFLKEQSQETDRKFQDTDRKFQDTDRKFQDTDRKIKAVSTQIGQLGNRLGDFVEEMIRPAAVRIFRARGLGVHQVLRDLTAYDDQGEMQSQVDLLVINANVAIVIECKSQMSMDDVNDHLQRLDMFKSCFPQYAALTILGAVAGMVLPVDVGRYAYRKGLFVLAQSGDGVVIRNDEAFKPKQW